MADEILDEKDASAEETAKAEATATEVKAKAEADAKAKGEADVKVKAEADTKAKAEAETKVKATYEKFEFKLPQGSLLDAGAIERTVAFAKERGLSAEHAQALLDRESKLLTTHAEGQQKTLKDVTAKWIETAKADSEIGGEKFAENAELAKRVIARFGSDGLKKGLEETGLGNHPDLVRVFMKIGRAMSEDQLVLPGSKTAATRDMADLFYGSTDKKE